MEEGNQPIHKIRKFIPEIVLVAINVIFLIIISAYSGENESGIKLFIFAAVFALDIVGIHSMHIYKRDALNQGSKARLKTVLRIIWNFSIALCLLAVWYKISYSSIVIEDNSYWIYDLLVWYVIISFTLIYIKRFLKERKRIIEEKEGFTAHLLNFLYIGWILGYFNILAFYWMHIPKKTYDLSSAPKPSEIHVYEHIKREMDIGTILQSRDREVKIEDDKLLDRLTRELSQNTIETIRGVKYLRYSPGSRKEIYYNIYLTYRDSNGSRIDRPYKFEEMHFDRMTLYRNGELVLENYIRDRNILNLFYRTELYKVNLSQELRDEIIGMLESGNPSEE